MFLLASTPHALDCPLVMGIVNVTPDSFSDGGAYLSPDAAIAHAHQLIADGADILDVGGESTRPGAIEVSVKDELARVIPVLSALRDTGIPLSIDTQKPEVMRAAIAAGATMVNDVNALQAQDAIEICTEAKVAVCLMHMRGAPRTMQQAPHYDDVVAEVATMLVARARACEAAGIDPSRIAIDPGFGFGKTLDHNLALLRGFRTFVETGYTTLAGLSRKSMFKALLGRDTDERLLPSVLAAMLAVQRGAHILRVHDVRETVDALKLLAEVDKR